MHTICRDFFSTTLFLHLAYSKKLGSANYYMVNLAIMHLNLGLNIIASCKITVVEHTKKLPKERQ